MKYFVTGTAGFIGYHLAQRLLAAGHQVTGYDGMTPYYDLKLKQRRHDLLREHESFSAIQGLLEDKAQLESSITDSRPDVIVHLAAQAGVRYSIDHPDTYVSSNLVGTFNILEAARACNPAHLLIASTSSVYGGNEKMPFEERDLADHPVSLYAATKKACESMSHAYAHLFGVPTTCFRFFTVYGPWGRPDMALFKFVSAIASGRPIDVYGMGQMRRDFTYIDDLVEGIVRLSNTTPEIGKPLTAAGVSDSLSPVAPWRVVNIAGGQPVGLMEFIEAIERKLGRTADKNMLPMQQGDVVETFADPRLLMGLTGFVPSTTIDVGVGAFVDWYTRYTSTGRTVADNSQLP